MARGAVLRLRGLRVPGFRRRAGICRRPSARRRFPTPRSGL